MIEASALKKIVINSNCPSGPKEFFDNGKTGFLFQNNNVESLNAKDFDKFMKSKKNKINFLVGQSYKKSLNYSEISHAKNLKKIFKNL
jgi:glycosyltransferase involved in cell wall biosynthesis